MCDSGLLMFGPTEKRVSQKLVTLGEYYTAGCRQRGDKVAIVQQVNGVEISVTYAQLLRHGKIVSSILREHGLVSGDTVMLCCGNTLQFAPIMLGTLFVGAALAPVNPAFDKSDMLHMIGIIKPQAFIFNEQAESCVQEALSQYDASVALITMEAVKKRLEEDPDVEDFYLGEVEDPDTHVAFVLCSSGTSGKPKGVEYTHTGYFNLLQIPMFPLMDEGKDQQGVVLNLTGPLWMTCHLMTLWSFHYAYKLVVLESYSDAEFFSLIQQYGINVALLGPSQVASISRYPSTESYDLSSLRGIMHGGAPSSTALVQAAALKLRHHLTVVYGMTEGMALSPDFAAAHKIRSCGTLGTNVTAKIVHVDTGKCLGPDSEGELCWKSQGSFSRYRDNQDATSAAFDADGFLHTGDIAYYDVDGYFYIIDRIKELIKYKRDHVPALDIEEVLILHPAVLEAAVIGVYHETDWEHATAVVVVKPGMTVTKEELVKLVQGSLPSYKWLHGGVKFTSSLPRTATGKVHKYVMRRQYSKRV